MHLLYSTTRLSLTTHPQLLGYNVRPSSRHHSRSSLNAFFCVHLTHSTPIRYHDDVLEIYERSPTFFLPFLSLSLFLIILLLCVQVFRRWKEDHMFIDDLDYQTLDCSTESPWIHLIILGWPRVPYLTGHSVIVPLLLVNFSALVNVPVIIQRPVIFIRFTSKRLASMERTVS